MPGIFVLSLDTEIAWGTYTNLQARAPSFDSYPQLLSRLVRQLNIFEISATWAVVGHLLMEPGERTNIPQPTYDFASQPDSERVYSLPEHWIYGRYIVDTIQQMRIPQEIGTHTFTHLLATNPAVTREMFIAQLAEVVRVHKEIGLPPPRSIVYPQNRVAYTDVLPEWGIHAYRGVEESWYQNLPGIIKRAAHMMDRGVAATPPTYDPKRCRVSDQLVNVPASQFLMSYDGVRAKIPTEARVRQAARGINKAIEDNQIYHLWFHPFNLGSSDDMLDALTQILALVWDARERGQIKVMTMAELATDLLGNSGVTLDREQDHNHNGEHTITDHREG